MTTEQKNLFELEPPPWQADADAERLVATVVISGGPAGTFDYEVPPRMASRVAPGQRVRIRLGKSQRQRGGYCVAVETRRGVTRPLKPLSAVIDGEPLLSAAMLRLTKWIAEYYLADWGQVLEAVIPAGVRGRAGTRVASLLSVAPEVASRIDELELPAKQSRALAYLVRHNEPLTPAQLAHRVGCTQAPITALRRKGLVQERKRRIESKVESQPEHAREDNFVPNTDQQRALDAISEALHSARHQTLLLDGVTGSGKTEIYIQAIQQVVRGGRQAIVLVPEIALTPQTMQRFQARFDDVAVLHSHLTDAERHGHWRRIAAGEVQVVVGARSAVFAPVPRLGLIVIDEEHESSFKQESAPRYHAREVARRRAADADVPLVLGSATPSLETWYQAQSGTVRRIMLPRRVFDRPLPDVATIDLRNEAGDRHWRGAISRPLYRSMAAALESGGQVILLLNRRGFATHIQCPKCGEVVRCPSCDIALTHHRQKNTALCHYCDFEQPAPQRCPECDFAGIRYSGMGTERLELEVKARFPEHRCVRMDTDAMQARGAHEQALSAFRRGEVRILLGTQMIAKGLDFPNVTLVGVVNADTALHLPDFRAAERTFQLLAQVAGRTGRGEKGGRVLVQTYSPEHPAIRAVTRHDYEAFAGSELPHRQLLGYPPFASMVRVVVRGRSRTLVAECARQLAAHVAAAAAGASLRVLGPAPAPIAKLRELFRYHMQLQGPDGAVLREALRTALAELRPPKGIETVVDVDPLSML